MQFQTFLTAHFVFYLLILLYQLQNYENFDPECKHSKHNTVFRRPMQGNPRQSWILDSMMLIIDSTGFRMPCQGTWDSRFQSLPRFRFTPELYLGFQIPGFPIRISLTSLFTIYNLSAPSKCAITGENNFTSKCFRTFPFPSSTANHLLQSKILPRS